ncbi:hypothetical protein [Flavobacterium sp. TSSA_36]|uniref:hypothetical protein n=1 Tax=Flavobacterium sp. TSSA_36 TaxID=3447669 RepID=UPI003F3F2FB8
MAIDKKIIFLKTVKYLGIAFGSILVVMFLTPIIFSDTIKEEVKKYANTKLEGELNYGDANLSFFKHFPSLTLTLNDVNLNGSIPFEKEKFVSAKEIAFGIDVSSLVFGKAIDIDQIIVTEGNINVKVDKNGQANYNVYKGSEQTSKKVEEKNNTALQLQKIEIINSKVVYDDQSTAIHLDLFDFNYIGKGDLASDVFDLYSKIAIAKMNFIYENEPYLMNKKVEGDLITKVNVNSLSFIFEQNNLNINRLLVDFKGKFDFLKDGYNIDFNIKSKDSELYDLINAFPPKFITWLEKTEIKGKTDLLLTLKGKYITSEKIAPDLHLDLKVKDGFVNYNKSKFPVSNLNVDFKAKLQSLDPNQLLLDVNGISLNIEKEYLKAKWHSKGVENIELNGELFSFIDLEKLNNALGIPNLTIKGLLTGKGTMNGTYNAKTNSFPIADIAIDLKNGFIQTEYYPNPITNINCNATIKNQKGSIDDLKVRLQPASFTFEQEPFKVEANLENFKDLTYDVKAKGVLNISKIYKVFSQKGLDVDGYIKTDLALKGKQSDAEKGNYSKLNSKGTLEIRNIAVASTYLPKKLLIKEGIFKFNQDKMSFNTFLASYSQSDFKLNGYLKNVFNFLSPRKGTLKGAFTLQSKYINVNEFMSSENPTVLKEVNTTTSKTDNSITEINTTSTGVIIIPKNLDLQFKAIAQKVDFQELHLTKANGNLKMKNGKLHLQNTNFNLIGCQVGMSALYESLTTKKALFEYQIKATDFDIKRAYKEVKIFREMASAAEKAQGIVSLDYKLKGRLNANMEPVFPSLVGNGVLSVKDIKLYGMKMFNVVGSQTNHDKMKNPELSKVEIKSSIKNNIMTIERFKFKFAGFRPRIEGTTSLDGRLNLKMRLGLPPFGLFGIPITVTGNKDNPKIKVGRETQDLEEKEDKETE